MENFLKENNLGCILSVFVPLGILFLVITLIISFRQDGKRDEFYEKFDLIFKGKIISREDMHNHGQTKVIIKVAEANKKEYSTKKDFIWNYCVLRNDTATMYIYAGSCYNQGDSIFIGPHKKIVIKSGNDTIWAIKIQITNVVTGNDKHKNS